MRFRLVFILVLMLAVAGCAGMSAPTGSQTGMQGMQAGAVTPPANLDLSTTQASEQGLFTVSYTSDLDPLTINKLNIWTLHVEDAGGAPLDGATVSIDGGMPEHNHGMPTQPIVSALGGGDYKVEGMKFQMPGWWTVTVVVDDGGRQDKAVFNLMLP